MSASAQQPGSGELEQITQRPAVSDPIVRRIRSSWRQLTGGTSSRDPDRRTLIACSGGADSAALVLALASIEPAPVVAHVVHDLRTPLLADSDRVAVAKLASALGLAFVESRVEVMAQPGNAEANARDARLRALDQLAHTHGLAWIATGHHADDQAETLLMRLLRGAGPEGLAGIRETRPLSRATLIRPMLGVTHEDARDLCVRCDHTWQEDHTNQDRTRTRASLRHAVLPAIRAHAANAAHKLSEAASLQGELTEVLGDAVLELHREAVCEKANDSITLQRQVLQSARPIVVNGLLRKLCGDLGRDQRGREFLQRVCQAIQDNKTEPREFRGGGATIQVGSDWVDVSPATH